MTTIAFTSCVRYKPGKSQQVWDQVLAAKPDYLFLLGDQIYMDYGFPVFSDDPINEPKGYSVEEFGRIMCENYQRQWDEPSFKQLMEAMRAKPKKGFYGVWDDHDFAWNNAYGNDASLSPDVNMQEKKEISRTLFHKFMDCSTNLPEVYYHIDINLARVIFLDNRYYATPPNARQQTPALMGAAQMEFLRQAMNHDLQYTLICGGLTLTHGTENWSQYTSFWDRDSGEYREFQRMVEASGKRVLYLCGDIHDNAFAPPGTRNGWFRKIGPPCYEIVASGMFVNKYGVSAKFDDVRNWGMLKLSQDEVRVRLHSKKGVECYRIDANTWESEKLDRDDIVETEC